MGFGNRTRFGVVRFELAGIMAIPRPADVARPAGCSIHLQADRAGAAVVLHSAAPHYADLRGHLRQLSRNLYGWCAKDPFLPGGNYALELLSGLPAQNL